VHYGYNGYLLSTDRDADGDWLGLSLGAIKNSSQVAFFADSAAEQVVAGGRQAVPNKDLMPPLDVPGPPDTFTGPVLTSAVGPTFHARHRDRSIANVGWADGHVSAVRPVQYIVADPVNGVAAQSDFSITAALGFLDPNDDDVRENDLMFVK
jgi:prepilin-type processing-associated H-X9-DG protein